MRELGNWVAIAICLTCLAYVAFGDRLLDWLQGRTDQTRNEDQEGNGCG